MPTSICGIEGPLVPQTNHLCSPPFMQDMDIQNYASSIHISNQMKQTDPLGSRNFELTFHSSLSSSREKLSQMTKMKDRKYKDGHTYGAIGTIT